jgi:drug/metabolite transporter (DMT)-like permease
VTFGAALSVGDVLGDLLALVMTVLMALMMVIIRRNQRVSMLPAACLSAFACALVVLPLAQPGDVTGQDFVWLGLFGTLQFGLSLLLLTIGSRQISATPVLSVGQSGTTVCPLWVWLALGELPTRATCVGGAIVPVAILLELGADQWRARDL